MRIQELHQKAYQTEQLIDTKLTIITFLREMEEHVGFELQLLLQQQHSDKQRLAQTTREM